MLAGNAMPGLEACSCAALSDYLRPREAGLLALGLLSALALLLAALSFFDSDQYDDLRHWAQRPWVADKCAVLKTGISYVGDCKGTEWSSLRPQHRPPAFNYSECPAAAEHERCREIASRALHTGRRLGARTQPNLLCRDIFLPWASVRLFGRQHCAYRTGLAEGSRVFAWDEALRSRKALEAAPSLTCWLLKVEAEPSGREGPACSVLALQAPSSWPEVDGSFVEHQRAIRSALLCGAFLAATAAAAVAVAHRWCFQADIQRWADPVEQDSLSMTAREVESARLRDVRDRWNLFRASILAEYQPLDSSRNVELVE